MEHSTSPEYDPVILEKARTLMERLDFGDYADAVLEYRGKQMTFAEGLAQHWDEVSQLDGAAIYERIAGYKALYNAQQSELGNS